MLKTKQRRFAVVAILLFSMITMYGGIPAVNASAMDSGKVTLADSDPGNTATTTITFDLATALVESQYVKVVFPTGFTGITVGNVTCPDLATPSVNGQEVICTAVAGGIGADVAKNITVKDVTNPGTTGDYSFFISSHESGGTEIESIEVKVYIIDNVTVTAHVAASLTFAIEGLATSTLIKGDLTTGSTSPNRIDFKTLEVDMEQRMAQKLTVSTNASGGFVVTVQQDGNMVSAGGADINSFNTAGPIDWASPAANYNDPDTFGHMGLTTDDPSYSFTDGFYQGLDGTNPLEIFTHDGSAAGLVTGVGTTNVMYNIEISALQEAGDYQNTLTYVCTPTF